MPRTNTADRLLDEAERLVRTRGFNAFSYRDLAAAIDIRTASIHYHFPTKADLGLALVTRYRQRLQEALADIDRESASPKARVQRFVQIYREAAESGDQICLCGSLASDASTLPEPLREAVGAYFDESVDWVAGVFADGEAAHAWPPLVDPHATASLVVSALQGALLHARLIRNQAPVTAAGEFIERLLGG